MYFKRSSFILVNFDSNLTATSIEAINLAINVEKQLKIRVFGKVQGVWYRQSTKDKAEMLNLRGVVLNEADGSVYIEVRGQETDLDDFVVFCKIGPVKAKVENVILEEMELTDFRGFSIIR